MKVQHPTTSMSQRNTAHMNKAMAPSGPPQLSLPPLPGKAMRVRRQRLRSAPVICLVPVPIWLMAAALESEMVASLAAVCGLVLAAVWARGMLRHTPQLLGFLRLGSASLLAIMSLGWLVAQFFNFTALDQSMTVALVRDVGTSLAAYSMAVAYALVFAAVLGLLGGLKPFRTLEARALTGILAARSIRSNRLHALIMLICILEIALILTGVISYRTYAIEGFDEGRIAWYLPLLEFMFAAQIALNALAISQLTGPLSSRRASIAVIAVSVLLILFINFTRGRASFVFCALLHLYWVILFIGRIPNKKTLILVALAALPIIYTGSLLNNFMRSGAVQGLDVKVIGSSAFFREALQLWRDDESLQAAEKSRSAYNLASRPLVASPLAKCIALPAEQKNFLLGENLFNSAVWALPRAIFPDKTRYPIQEDLLYSSFPVGTEDTADSPYLYAYADFGYVGIIIYPALLAGFWMAILLLARLPYISSLGIIVIMAVWIPFFTLNLGEAAMVGWFVGLRNTVLALPFIFFIGKLFRSPGAPANQSK